LFRKIDLDMTQEEKARAYDEALEKAKIEINTKGIGETVNLCKQLFPELAKSDDEESEDERIRKELIGMIKACTNWEHKKEYIAYLEKQKESLPISEICKENANSFIDGIIEVRSFQRGMEEGRRLERQKEPENKSASTMAPSCWEVKQKEQKPVECIEFDNEFEKQVSHLLASVLNGEWEYDEGFVKHAAQSLLGYAKNELKQELPLMGGDTDAYFDDLRITTKPLTSREWFDEGIKYAQRLQKEQKHNYCLYGGYPNVGRCRWCSAACSARLADVHTDEEKEYIRTIKSIISDFIRDKKPENLAYYQRIYDWLDGRHVPFSYGHENGKSTEWAELQSEFKNINEAFEDGKKEVIDHPDKYGLTKQKTPDPVFSKQEYESYPIISTDTTSAKPVERSLEDDHIIGFVYDLLNEIEWKDDWAMSKEECLRLLSNYSPQKFTGVTINGEPIPTETKSVDIPLAEWSEEDEEMRDTCIDLLKHFPRPCGEVIGPWKDCTAWLKSLPEKFVLQPKQEWSEEDEHIANILEFIVGKNRPDEIFKIGNKQGISAYKMCSWLKHLPERFNLQPKQEWSKEDEEIYTFVCNFFETCWWNKTWDISREQVLQMLKSLRPQQKQKM
jgi:hypothetical protein